MKKWHGKRHERSPAPNGENPGETLSEVEDETGLPKTGTKKPKTGDENDPIHGLVEGQPPFRRPEGGP